MEESPIQKVSLDNDLFSEENKYPHFFKRRCIVKLFIYLFLLYLY